MQDVFIHEHRGEREGGLKTIPPPLKNFKKGTPLKAFKKIAKFWGETAKFFMFFHKILNFFQYFENF
jgi:hypothetical protein